MKQYKDYIQWILDQGVQKGDRTGTGTLSAFGAQMRFDLSKSFPLVTMKKTVLRSIIHELLWFLKGDTNIRYLLDNDVHIWDEWSKPDGSLGPVYGAQWRSWLGADGQTVDQISWVINRIKTNPDCRRLIVSAWNVPELPKMALAPCHALFQFWSCEMTETERMVWANDRQIYWAETHADPLDLVACAEAKRKIAASLDAAGVPKRKLSCQLYQRSVDSTLGLPFNIASYALLTMMIAQVCDHALGDFVWTGGDCHIYLPHLEGVNLMMEREPKTAPTMKLNPNIKDINDFTIDDFTLVGYDPHPFIKFDIAV